jgi:hypothetical protein
MTPRHPESGFGKTRPCDSTIAAARAEAHH